jgi:hypothetical protein
MCQMLTGSMPAAPDMDHLFEITQKYIDTLHANCPAAREYTHDMLIEDYAMAQSIIFCGLSAPFAGLLEGLPDGHPLWVLFDACFDRFIKVGLRQLRDAHNVQLFISTSCRWLWG